MNCKPRDIARVIRGEVNYGRIVQCLELFTTEVVYLESKCGKKVCVPVGKAPRWHIDGHLAWLMHQGQYSGMVLELPIAYDEDLMPLGNPGEDAQDEMLRPLPKAEPADTRTGQEVAA